MRGPVAGLLIGLATLAAVAGGCIEPAEASRERFRRTFSKTTTLLNEKAIQLDGVSETVGFNDDNSLDAVADLTYGCQAYPESAGTNDVIISKWNATTSNASTYIDLIGTNGIRFRVATNLAGTTTFDGSTANNKLPNTTWTSVIGRYRGGEATNADKMQVWINGVNEALTFSGTAPATLQNSTATVRLGFFTGASAVRAFSGYVDECF